jgi:hypothetical protein
MTQTHNLIKDGLCIVIFKIYNTYKVSNVFDHVIWVTVAQFSILQMQNDIASTINLDLANCSTDMGKMKLCAYIENIARHVTEECKGLPSRIGELTNLSISIFGDCNLMVIHDEIRKLPNCEIVIK